MTGNRKPLLSYNDLINKMENNGIQFNIINKMDAKTILQNRNYYYKISSYRKLFDKTDGKYNIEFATLADLAVIDMLLRYFLLDICLDVEHSIKTALMDVITKNPKIDGYDIVKDYAVYNSTGYNYTINALSKNKYLQSVYTKNMTDIPICVLIEVMDFGNLHYLVEMYCDQNPSNKKLKKAKQLGKYARHIRNACAHSNVLLVDMLQQIISPSSPIISIASNLGLDRETLKYRKIHDIFTLVMLHREYCSSNLQKQRFKEFIQIARRAKKHKEYYETNHKIVSIYTKILKTLVKTPKK